MTRLIEALLVSPRAGQAVARALEAQCDDRAARVLIAEMRLRRAERLRDSALDEAEARGMGAAASDGGSPWARSR
ncbi:hypothetical protein HKCCSP123_08065 [Rhodobacterales bacterium HKCCSP123]|nr:hypothetical protein [Rhodobacterales bacterium HKCCSP123]